MFADQLEQNLTHMRAFARLLCKNPSVADDLVQEACLKAWAARDRFDPSRGSLRPWLFRIIRNEFYQRGRRNWRSVNIEVDQFESLLTAECGLEARSDLRRMLAAIGALKPTQRDAFFLVVAAGFTYEEVAEVCQSTAGTIKSRVSRAREHVLATFHSDQALDETTFAADKTSDNPIELLETFIQRVKIERKAA